MIKELIDYLKQHKQDFAPTQEYQMQAGFCSTCWRTEDVCVNDLNMDALWGAIEAFESTFQEGGENAHRNPLNKE